MALYWLIPNRVVRAADAAVGAAVAAVLFEIAKAGFVVYLTAVPVSQTIYGAIAVIPIFLLWLYVAWSIVLGGARSDEHTSELQSLLRLPYDGFCLSTQNMVLLLNR